MTGRHEAVVVGAGQAGLATSYWLRELGVEHQVLERGSVANTWSTERWDSFHLNSPNSFARLPGMEYGGPDPDGFMARDDVVDYLARYASQLSLPVREGVEVHQATPTSEGWKLTTSHDDMESRALVVAAGAFTRPKVPGFARHIDPAITQMSSSAYRNARALPAGNVLIVGAAQSGVQIAEDLLAAGRRVFMAIGKCPRIPRTYRGRDIFHWMEAVGILHQHVDDLPGPAARNACHPQVAAHPPPDLDVRSLAARGAVILGRADDAKGLRLKIVDDALESLQAGDERSMEILDTIDDHIRDENIKAAEPDPVARDLTPPPIDHRSQLDLAAEGISTIVWATGFHHDWPWLAAPSDDDGYPVHRDGVAPIAGLYYVGLHFLKRRSSGLLAGVGIDAERIARRVAESTGRA